MDPVIHFPKRRQIAAPGPYTILVVEDDVLVRMVTADELREHGFDVLEAYNAEEALTLLQSPIPIGLLFTDVQMPGSMDGLELAALVANTHPELKIIITSGNGSLEARAVELADAFLLKPYLPNRLCSCIQNLFADDAE
jgi:two-component system, response regulator PdtaR